MDYSIFTIGYGRRSIEDFVLLLERYKIKFLVDVRSQPYSKYNPEFSQNELKSHLLNNGIKYVFMGYELGGRPEDITCYDSEGKVDYEKVKCKDFYQLGINRLKTAYEQQVPVVIMCSESNPCDCHRSKLIGRTLFDNKMQIRHIDENDKLKSQADIINELNKGLSDTTLFPDEVDLNKTSRKSYL